MKLLLTALLLVFSPPIFASILGLLNACTWRTHEIDADDLHNFRRGLLASEWFKPPLSPEVRALKDRLEAREFTDVMQYAEAFEALMEKRGWPENLRQALLEQHPRRIHLLFTDKYKLGLPALEAAAKEKGPLLDNVISVLGDNEHLYSTGMGVALADAHEIMKMPAAQNLKEDLNEGTGNSSSILKARIPPHGELVVKIQKERRAELSLVDSDERVYKSLEPYGGPKYYGKHRIFENGVWRPGVALEIIPGRNLLSLEFERLENTKPSLLITEKHVKSMEDFIKRIQDEQVYLVDIQPGDFMFLPDGRMRPLDMEVKKKGPGSADQKGYDGGLVLLKEKLEMLKTIRAFQQGYGK